MAAFVILIPANGCFTKENHSIVPTFKKAAFSLKYSFVKRKRSPSFAISRYFFAGSMPYVT